jgi:hypothetical protein
MSGRYRSCSLDLVFVSSRCIVSLHHRTFTNKITTCPLLFYLLHIRIDVVSTVRPWKGIRKAILC